MRREQRLVFGEVAELYDRHRPAYPGVVVDDLIGLAALGPGALVLEVGAGTGKATAMFAQRGIRVLAVEPSAEMAVVARRLFEGGGQVQERELPAGGVPSLVRAGCAGAPGGDRPSPPGEHAAQR